MFTAPEPPTGIEPPIAISPFVFFLKKKFNLIQTHPFLFPRLRICFPVSWSFSITLSYQLTIFSSLPDSLISNFSPPLSALTSAHGSEAAPPPTRPHCVLHSLLFHPFSVKHWSVNCHCFICLFMFDCFVLMHNEFQCHTFRVYVSRTNNYIPQWKSIYINNYFTI